MQPLAGEKNKEVSSAWRDRTRIIRQRGHDPPYPGNCRGMSKHLPMFCYGKTFVLGRLEDYNSAATLLASPPGTLFPFFPNGIIGLVVLVCAGVSTERKTLQDRTVGESSNRVTGCGKKPLTGRTAVFVSGTGEEPRRPDPALDSWRMLCKSLVNIPHLQPLPTLRVAAHYPYAVSFGLACTSFPIHVTNPGGIGSAAGTIFLVCGKDNRKRTPPGSGDLLVGCPDA